MEFALVAPILVALGIGLLCFGFGFWTRNALQETASETARCVAIRSSICGKIPTGCLSKEPAACYFQQVAAKRGLSGILEREIVVNRTATYGGMSFTAVSVIHPLAIGGYTFSIEATGYFPNSS